MILHSEGERENEKSFYQESFGPRLTKFHSCNRSRLEALSLVWIRIVLSVELGQGKNGKMAKLSKVSKSSKLSNSSDFPRLSELSANIVSLDHRFTSMRVMLENPRHTATDFK